MLVHELIVRVLVWCPKSIIIKILPLRGKILFYSSEMLREHKLVCDLLLYNRLEMPFFKPYDLFDTGIFMMNIRRYKEIQESINYTSDTVDKLKCLKDRPEILVDTASWEIITGMNYKTTLMKNLKCIAIMLCFIVELMFKNNRIFIKHYQKIRKEMVKIIGKTLFSDTFEIINPVVISERQKEKIIEKALKRNESSAVKNGLRVIPQTDQRIFNQIQYPDTDLAIHYWAPQNFPVSSNLVLQIMKFDCTTYERILRNSVNREIDFYKSVLNEFLSSILTSDEIEPKKRLDFYALTRQLVDMIPLLELF